ncbi:MAG TPA: hypothetical protein DC013_00425 [Ruminococcaceae bacterium]|nr:hypothetical protein [Oscillospiraceae bacterium]
MKCQVCGKNPATTHVKMVVNGELSEYYICSECAQKMGYGNLFSNFAMDFNSLLGSFFGDDAVPEMTDTLRCPGCGSTFEEIARIGQVGCAECYKTFRDRLMPSIQRIHGNTRHCGKRPFGGALRVHPESKLRIKKETPLDKKRRELREAVEKQDFERAAVLRDEIKEMEKGDQNK